MKYEIFLQWSTKFFLQQILFLYILGLDKIVWILQILSEKSTGNFRMKVLRALESHVLENMLLCSSHFTEVHEIYIGT